MNRFLIKYTRQPGTGSVLDWHRHIEEFISGLESDPDLKGRIRYTCMKAAGSDDYYHLAEPLDETVGDELQKKDFFKPYTQETNRVAGGKAEVMRLETIAETKR